MKDRTLPKIAFRNLFDRVPEFYQGQSGKTGGRLFCRLRHHLSLSGDRRAYGRHPPPAGLFGLSSRKPSGAAASRLLSSGNGPLVEELAESNVAAFGRRQVDHIVTACASCNRGTKEYYAGMKGDFGGFAGKVVDFSVFLKNDGYLARLAGMEKRPARVRVTYHDPCHLKTQGITREPRELLQSLAPCRLRRNGRRRFLLRSRRNLLGLAL